MSVNIFMHTSAQYINVININQQKYVLFSFKPSWLTLNLLRAYSEEVLKSNADKAFPCFKSFLTENMSEKCLPTQTLL